MSTYLETRKQMILLLSALITPFLVHAASPSDGKSAQQTTRLPTVAVIPFSSQILDSGAMDGITSALGSQLLNSGKFRVLERSQINAILQEQGFQQSGACSGSECAVEVGKILAVDQMAVGSISKVGETFTVSARLVNVQTGEVIASSTRNCKAKVDDILIELIPKLSEDLSKRSDGDNAANNQYSRGNIQTLIGSMKDPRDGKTYKTTKIGTQIWMAENMNYNSKGSVCYDDNPLNCDNFGRLYDWETSMNTCPKGWHLPSVSEWLRLNEIIQTDVGLVLCSKKASKKATDDYSFSATPIGQMVRVSFISSRQYQPTGYATFWTSTGLEKDMPYMSKKDYKHFVTFKADSDTIAVSAGLINGHMVKEYAISVRCVEDDR